MNNKRKKPKSWDKQFRYAYGHRKSYSKSRYIKARKRYWMHQVMAWAYPDYLTTEQIIKGFYIFCEMRGS